MSMHLNSTNSTKRYKPLTGSLENQKITINNHDPQLLTAQDIQVWLSSHLAKLLEIDLDEVDTTIPFNRYGLDSVAVVDLTADLEKWLGFELEPIIMYTYPTIEVLAQHLAERL